MENKMLIRAALLWANKKTLPHRKVELLLAKVIENREMLFEMINNNGILRTAMTVASAERVRQVWKFDRSGTFWEYDVRAMDDVRFKENFRMKRRTFSKLCECVRSISKVDSNMRKCIPLDKRVTIALFALGSSAEYRTIGSLFGVGRSTVGEIVLDFCKAVCDTLSHCINTYPPQQQEIRRIVGGFAQQGFPQCFGAIDGCHIEVQPRKEDAVDYHNYKGWYSVILLACCDHKSKFTYINVGSTGKNNDSYIFENSSLKRFHESTAIFAENSKSICGVNVPVLLIGDSAFRLSPYVMKPYPYLPNQPPIEKRYNYFLSKNLRVIENAFGQYKARFRRIGRGLQVAPKNVNAIIRACCILHNFLKMEADEVCIAWMQDLAEDTAARSQPSHTTRAGENNPNATCIRNAIALSLRKYIHRILLGNSRLGRRATKH